MYHLCELHREVRSSTVLISSVSVESSQSQNSCNFQLCASSLKPRLIYLFINNRACSIHPLTSHRSDVIRNKYPSLLPPVQGQQNIAIPTAVPIPKAIIDI